MSDALSTSSNLGGLPNSSDIDVYALSRLFERNTTSYKYLFFLSILEILEREAFEIETIEFKSLILEMLVNAWAPCIVFSLSLGSQDKIDKLLNSLNLIFDKSLKEDRLFDKTTIREMIARKDLSNVVSHLRKHVPFRLIIPFLEDSLDGIDRGRGTELEMAIPEIANRCFDSHKPLYKFNSVHYRDCRLVLLHPNWIDYLSKNHKVVRRWAEWEWLSYMKNRNPSISNLDAKILPKVKV